MRGIKCIYISYEKTDVETREKVVLSQEELGRFLCYLKEQNFADEFVVISTCNRTEVYYLASHDLQVKFVRLIERFKRNELTSLERTNFVSETNAEKSITRLLEVVNGLRSQVLGDFQIVRQVKNAYDAACKAGTAGPYLHRLLQMAFSCYKAVANQTHIHAGSASVSYAAFEITRDFLKKERNKPVLIIGAGSFSAEVIHQLKKKGIENLFVANRSREKAAALASRYDISILNFLDMDDVWCFDVIISCVSVPEVIIKRQHFAQYPSRRRLLIDLSVPRSIDPCIGAVEGVKLINMNQVSEKNTKALLKRKNSIPMASNIIGDYRQQFCQWERGYLSRHNGLRFAKALEAAF